MSKKAFDDIMAGLQDAAAIVNGTADPATYRVHQPVDVKAIRKGLGLSQEAFAREFGLSPGAVRDWEQDRKNPDMAARSLLAVIAKEPEAVRRALQAV